MSLRCALNLCRPAIVYREGADHTGDDVILRCPKCRRRTDCHVEASDPLSEGVASVLRREWKHGKTTMEAWL